MPCILNNGGLVFLNRNDKLFSLRTAELWICYLAYHLEDIETFEMLVDWSWDNKCCSRFQFDSCHNDVSAPFRLKQIRSKKFDQNIRSNRNDQVLNLNFILNKLMHGNKVFLDVVYFDQLLKLVKTLFSAVFNLFCSFYNF